MTRVCLVYFSPTGGTKLVASTAARAMAEELKLPLEEFDITLPASREKEYVFSDGKKFEIDAFEGGHAAKIVAASYQSAKSGESIEVDL